MSTVYLIVSNDIVGGTAVSAFKTKEERDEAYIGLLELVYSRHFSIVSQAREYMDDCGDEWRCYVTDVQLLGED